MRDALLAGKGYRAATVSGPFTGREGSEEYVVTFLELEDAERRTLRGTFAERRAAIEGPPRYRPPWRRRSRRG
jgi:hypothetical protein